MKRNEEKRELYLKQEPVKKEQLRVKNQEQILKAAQDILISIPCASRYQHMCNKVGKSTQCPSCKHFYCDRHSQKKQQFIWRGRSCILLNKKYNK